MGFHMVRGAELILLYLQTRALRLGSPEIELGRSMREWLQRMGIPHGGKSYAEVRDQAARLSTCKLTFYYAASKGVQASATSVSSTTA